MEKDGTSSTSRSVLLPALEYVNEKRVADSSICLSQGLGTSTSADAKKYFSDMAKHMLQFDVTKEGDRDLIDLAFNKKKADDRKEWLRQFRVRRFLAFSPLPPLSF